MCATCGQAFSQANSHEWVVHGQKTFQDPNHVYCSCPLCHVRIAHATQVQEHIDRVHKGIKNHICHICAKPFGVKRHLQYHIRTHMNIYQFKCKYCDDAFVKRDSLRQHTWLHFDHKPYRCNLCGQALVQVNSMNLHMKKYHPELSKEEYRANRTYIPLVITDDMVPKAVTGNVGRKGKGKSKVQK